MTETNTNNDVIITVPQTGRQEETTHITSREPQYFYCTNCHKKLISVVTYQNRGGALCLMILLCLFCFPCAVCLCCINPFFYKKAVHTCPMCGKQVGVVK